MLRKPNVARHRTWPQQALPVLNAQGARRAVASLCGQPVPTEPSCRLGSSHNRDRAEARFGALRTGCAVRQSNNSTRQNNNSTGIFEEIGSMSLDDMFQTVRAAEQLERAGAGAGAMAAAQYACDLLLATSAEQLSDRDNVLKKWGRKSHDIANVLAAVGECARAFPSLVRTRRPWGCCARYV